MLEYVGDTEHHALSDPLHGVGLYALYGGVILYLLGHFGFKLRIMRHVVWTRLGATVLLVLLLPIADRVPALAALGMLAAVCGGLIAAELLVRTSSGDHESVAAGEHVQRRQLHDQLS